jgi:AcrR family transcriptional regulator
VGTAAQPEAEQSRSARKRRAVLEAALTVFLRDGYVGASMDEVAALATVSKATVYKHFADKQTLFAEIVTATVDEVSDDNYADVMRLADPGDVEADLHAFARRQLKRVMQPQILQFRRLVTGEAARFPALGRLFYERGPGRTMGGLAAVFERLAAAGRLDVTDPALAAEHFNWLVMSIPLNRAMLSGEDDPCPAAELDRYADAGVDVFLAAYGPAAATRRKSQIRTPSRRL